MALTSFGIKEKWLRMVIKVMPKHPDIFTKLTSREHMEDVQYLLGGIGNKQVLAIKDWCIGMGLIAKSDETYYSLTPFGKLIAECDPQIEEQGTLWAIHYNLCANSYKPEYVDKSEDIWFYSKYSNSFGAGKFSRDEVKACLKKYTKDGKDYADSVIEKMCMFSLLYTMSKLNTRIGYELGVFIIQDEENDIYERRRPVESTLHPAIIAYMLYDWAIFNSRLTMNTAEYLKYGSVARFMAMEEQQLNMYLNKIQDRYARNILWVSWTAGLNSVAFNNNIEPLALLRSYYIENQSGKAPLEALQTAIEIGRIETNAYSRRKNGFSNTGTA